MAFSSVTESAPIALQPPDLEAKNAGKIASFGKTAATHESLNGNRKFRPDARRIGSGYDPSHEFRRNTHRQLPFVPGIGDRDTGYPCRA